MKKVAVALYRALKSIPYRGSGRLCNICGASASRFLPFGYPQRDDAQCWRCHSLERHRLLWEVMTSHRGDGLLADARVMHIAPEACFTDRLRQLAGGGYLSADLYASGVDEQMDITAIPYPDGHFDSIICSHVLEHVPEDRKALKEFWRVLRPGGAAFLAVPIEGEKTHEDPSIVSPEARLEAFGQRDHVRLYGLDFQDRIAEAGFRVERIRVDDVLDTAQQTKTGITGYAGDIFLAWRDA